MNALPFPMLWGANEAPREWQARAFDHLWPIIRSRKPVIMQACTGSGKTRLQLAIVWKVLQTLRPGWTVIISVPKQSLVKQTYLEAVKVLPVGSVGRWYGPKKEVKPVIIVCHNSAPSLVEHLKSQSIRVAFWLADECHRADSDTVVDSILAAEPYTRLGVTATPFGSVAHPALRGWEDIAFTYTLTEAVDDGVLVPFRFVYHPRDGDDTNETVIEMIKRDAPPGPGLVSATDIIDAEWYADVLTSEGIPAVAVHSKMPEKEQLRRIANVIAGQYRALVHVDLLTEGRDIPGLRWLAGRRQRGSAVAIAQEAGRIARVCRSDDPSVAWSGEKTEAVILQPRYIPVLESISSDPNITPELTAERLQAAAAYEVNGPPKEVLLPPTEAASQVASYLHKLIRQAEEEGVEVAPRQPAGPWETLTPTPKQLKSLDELVANARKSPIKALPEICREEIRKVTQRPGLLTCGQMHDLLRLLIGLRRYQVAYARSHAHLPVNRQFWAGMKDAREAPPMRAVLSLVRAP
jgi:superfamily II DNA or RNA helicase